MYSFIPLARKILSNHLIHDNTPKLFRIRFHILTIAPLDRSNRSQNSQESSCSIFVHRDVSRLHYDTYRALHLSQREHGSCVEDRWEPPGNPLIRLQISNRVKQWLDTGKWHGLEITIRIPNDGPKRERRDPRAIGERWVTIRWRLIYIYSLDEISLGWPPRGYRHSGIVIAEPGRSSHLASIHELSSGSLSIFERRGDSRFN